MKRAVQKCLSFIIVAFMLFPLVNLISFASADKAPYKKGDRIEIGEYPQTLVSDPSIIEELEKNTLHWINDKTELSNTIILEYRMADTSYDGRRYRAVEILNAEDAGDAYSERINKTAWFLYEPVQWIIIDAANGFLLSKKVLDYQVFNKTDWLDSTWETATIRSWLNERFLNDAFSADEISIIQKTAENDCVGLLSLDDVLNPLYSFCDNYEKDWSDYYYGNQSLCKYATDYAVWLGAENHNGETGEIRGNTVQLYGTDWLLRKTGENTIRPGIVHETTNPGLKDMEDEAGNQIQDPTNAWIDYFDYINCHDFSGICPSVYVDLTALSQQNELGDIDGDATVAAADARLALRASVGLEELTERQKSIADVDHDHEITSADARLILRASVGLETLA